MNKRRKNIILFVTLILLSSFTISLSHSIMEQVKGNCSTHADHDFSKVIVNVSVPDDHSDTGKIAFCSFSLLPADISFINNLIRPIENSDFSCFSPQQHYEKLFISKYKALLI